MYVLFVTQCSIQGHSQIYRVRDMLKVLVIQCYIQLPACLSIFEVESTCLCFVRIRTKVVPFIVLAQILQCSSKNGFCLLKFG